MPLDIPDERTGGDMFLEMCAMIFCCPCICYKCISSFNRGHKDEDEHAGARTLGIAPVREEDKLRDTGTPVEEREERVEMETFGVRVGMYRDEAKATVAHHKHRRSLARKAAARQDTVEEDLAPKEKMTTPVQERMGGARGPGEEEDDPPPEYLKDYYEKGQGKSWAEIRKERRAREKGGISDKNRGSLDRVDKELVNKHYKKPKKEKE